MIFNFLLMGFWFFFFYIFLIYLSTAHIKFII